MNKLKMNCLPVLHEYTLIFLLEVHVFCLFDSSVSCLFFVLFHRNRMQDNCDGTKETNMFICPIRPFHVFKSPNKLVSGNLQYIL